MSDTTTIEVRTDQAEQLREIQRQNGNYKTAIDRLIETWRGEGEAIDADDLADKVSEKVVRQMGSR